MICLTPLAHFISVFWDESVINTFQDLMVVSGHSAIVFLLITLGITPIRRWLVSLCSKFPRLKWGKRLSDWNMLIRYRRLMGLMSFYYAVIHMLVYLYFELDFDFEEFIYDVTTRYHIPFGLVSVLLLFVLAITSFKRAVVVMGRWWRRVHRSVYAISILAVAHILLARKITDELPWLYAALVLIFLTHRVLVAYVRVLKRSDDTGLEHFRQR